MFGPPSAVTTGQPAPREGIVLRTLYLAFVAVVVAARRCGTAQLVSQQAASGLAADRANCSTSASAKASTVSWLRLLTSSGEDS